MNIYLGSGTLWGLSLGIGVPLVFFFYAWIRDWVEILSWLKKAKKRTHKENCQEDMSYSAHVTLMNGQYYRWIITQPFSETLPSIVLLSIVGFIVGLGIDNWPW